MPSPRHAIRILNKKNDNFAPVTCGVNLHESKWYTLYMMYICGPMFFRPCLGTIFAEPEQKSEETFLFIISKGAAFGIRHSAFWFSKHIF